MSENVFDAVAVIALRKSKYYQLSRDLLLKQLRPLPSNIAEKEIREVLRKAIAKIDNSLFLSEEEKSTGRIDPTARIETLRLDSNKIAEEVFRNIRQGNVDVTRI